jgi:tRNA-guanine family transglycosylase
MCGCEDFEGSLVKNVKKGSFRLIWTGLSIFYAKKSIDLRLLWAGIMMPLTNATIIRRLTLCPKVMERTHPWAVRSWTLQTKSPELQACTVSIQGGLYQDLREQSAKFISSLDFPGIANAEFPLARAGADALFLNWSSPIQPEEKPRI